MNLDSTRNSNNTSNKANNADKNNTTNTNGRNSHVLQREDLKKTNKDKDKKCC